MPTNNYRLDVWADRLDWHAECWLHTERYWGDFAPDDRLCWHKIYSSANAALNALVEHLLTVHGGD